MDVFKIIFFHKLRAFFKYCYSKIRAWFKIDEFKSLHEWKKKGKPVPPPHIVKQKTVKEYGKKFSIKILIETGTLYGQMVLAVKNNFEKIISIELDKKLYRKAKINTMRHENISVIHGDSSRELSKVLKKIHEPCLFWLDAHYSKGETAKGDKETPILEELQDILNHPVSNHVILIDDARCFIGRNDYPSINQLKKLLRAKHPYWILEVKDDIIRIHNSKEIKSNL
jgi:hypothetical protein